MDMIDISIVRQNRNALRFAQHKFDVYQYVIPFLKKNGTKQNDFSSDKLKMAYATARTLCSIHIDKKELYFDIISSLLSHLNFITKNTGDYLQLYESRLERLRDFSKTTRIGELAQGINYLFVQEELSFPFIIDYHLFCKKNNINVISGNKTPDFVILKEDFSESGLFESKGEAAKDPKITGSTGKIASAFEQLQSITSPCVDKLIPCVTRFETDGGTINSSIHYAVITKQCGPKTDIKLKLFRQHYASWFYLVGDFDRATLLLGDNAFTSLDGDPNYVLSNDNNNNEVYWVRRPIIVDNEITDEPNLRIFFHDNAPRFRDYKIGIYKSVIDSLIDENLQNKINFPTVSTNYIKRFADGTVIQLGNN